MLTPLSSALIRVAATETLASACATPTTTVSRANAPFAPTSAPMPVCVSPRSSSPMRLAALMPLLGMPRSKWDVSAIWVDAALTARYVSALCQRNYYAVRLVLIDFCMFSFPVECPSGADVLKGYGNEAGRDCSGRGLCDYSAGICSCFHGYYGTKCEYQTVLG